MRRKRETLLEMPRHVPFVAVPFGLIPALLRSEKGSDGCRMFEVIRIPIGVALRCFAQPRWLGQVRLEKVAFHRRRNQSPEDW